jgi:ArsR family transcriptional regulator
VFYRLASQIADPSLAGLWQVLREGADDPLVRQDRSRIPQVLASRTGAGSWADMVAGDMERHYSPGRTWEATARAMSLLLDLGDVLDVASGDGVLAELLASRARSITCLDLSERVVEAGQRRVAHLDNVEFAQGDMHAMPVADQSQDLVLLLHALTYTEQPERVFEETHRVLRPGGQLLAVTLQHHDHEKAVAPYDHRNRGFTEDQLAAFCQRAGLVPSHCGLAAVEKRPPHFAVLNLLAERPARR